MFKGIFKRLSRRIASELKFRGTKRRLRLRASSVAYNLVITGALRRSAHF